MNNAEAGKFLCGLKGTDVPLDPPSEPPFHLSRQTWVIDKKLSERSQWMTQQIPVIGTQYQSPQIRRTQAANAQPHVELTTLKALKILECDVVPDLLAYQEGKQGEDSTVPGGHITYVVWDKVPGEPLREEEFWELDLESRQAIRDQFREAYPQLRKCGYPPRMPTMSKIIYDKATGNMYALSVVE
ncbi:hypothetical protein IFM60648_04829 [Aspergillus lentulus]|uniref:Aminoglycoside phosphotransferase domain-containing protein n=1 Tax=Aspergillus lentulus TaxID=293939 RepID=A0ABQ1A9P0_ASPLE|nr:hypothetical protein IFM60648_04829 [Aspergillus lentulus]